MKIKKNGFNGGGPFNIIIVVALLVGCVFMLTKVTDSVRELQELSYSDYISLVKDNQVKQVSIDGSFVQGKTVEDKKFETVVPESDQEHWTLLKKSNVAITVVNAEGQFSWWHIILITLGLAIIGLLWFFLRPSRSMGGSGGGLFNIGKSKAKMFLPSTIKDTFASVAGATEAKEELKDIVDFLRNPEKYKKLGAKITRGALLVGEPGNGKTLLARAVAGEANCPFFSISGSDFIEVFVGVGAARVRDLFAQARKHAPSIIFIDEIDAVGRQRSPGGVGGGNDEREQTLNQLLTEMDGFEVTKDPVIVLAATNRPDVLDKALLRPGRIDRRVEVPYPDLASREQILVLHAKNVKIDPAVDMKKIARGTPGFSGADLANLINEAAIIASKNNQELVVLKDFEEARDKIILGKEIKTMSLTDEDRKITAYHEAGHALVRLLLPEYSDPLHKITIIPRGRALGVTHFMAEREKYHMHKEEILTQIRTALGGRIAEELVFSEFTTGACSDFQSATRLARRMVCSYGMSDLGTVIYDEQSEAFAYSPDTAKKIDEAIREIIKQCYIEARKLLTDNRDKLDILANALLEHETLYANEVYELLHITPRADHRFITE